MSRYLPTRISRGLSMPSWGTMFKVILGAGAVYVVYRVAKGLFPTLPSAEVLSEAEVKKLVDQGQRPSYTDISYASMANTIEQAGFSIGGTDEEAIYSVFSKMENDLDVVKLFEAFGERRMEFSLQTANLGGFLRSELSRVEMDKINTMLRVKGIRSQL